MTDRPDTSGVSRRNILQKWVIASGTTLLGGATMVGTASAIDDGFGFVPDGVDVGGTGSVTLVKRTGRERVQCAFSGSSYEVDTEVFEVDGYKETDKSKIYLATNKFEEGDTVKFLDENYDCPTSDPEALKEVDLGSIDF